MSSMTLLSQYLHIHFQFIFLLISSNLKLYLFLITNEIHLFSNIEGRLFYFLFSPLRPIFKSLVHAESHYFVISHSFLLPLVALCSLSVPDHSSMFSLTFINFFTLNYPKYWCFSFLHRFLLTPLIIWTTILILPCCHLFARVALYFLSFLLCCCPFYSTPSSSFHQKAAALFLSPLFIDPHTRYLMFLHMSGVPKSS
jgi:hypothetical protein